MSNESLAHKRFDLIMAKAMNTGCCKKCSWINDKQVYYYSRIKTEDGSIKGNVCYVGDDGVSVASGNLHIEADGTVICFANMTSAMAQAAIAPLSTES